MLSERQAYLAFNLVDGIGSATVEKLAAEAGSVAAAWEKYPKRNARQGGEVDLTGELARARRFGTTIVTPADEEYPAILKTAPGRPLALYVKGSVEALNKPAIAVVGTRRATSGGLNTANRLSYDLCKAGWSIVSGLAVGIDASAHRGALDADGVTVGVLGSGLDEFYPEQNRDLAREIVRRGGAVVSEFPFGRKPDRETFPIRNHVVAALARGLVAVEAPAKSGTLITADIACELGRTVMAVPGRIDDRMSAGCLRLIRSGSILVRNADDVLDALAELFPRRAKCAEAEERERAAADEDRPAYSPEEALLMLHVDREGVSLDELARLTELPIEKVSSVAMVLRLKGFIRFLPGNRIAAC